MLPNTLSPIWILFFSSSISALLFITTINLCQVKEAAAAADTATSTAVALDDGNSRLEPHEVDTFNAIRILHNKLDVDSDGEVDDFESKRFLESGATISNGNNKNGAYSNAHKLKYLHQDGKDRSISVDELWQAWKSSHVYNWTIDETVYWLVNYVELPEFSEIFNNNAINGSLLPRLAADSQFINRLGISDPSAKKKISIKAMDVVLFGPPKLGNSSKIRDIIVSIVTLIAVSACFVFYKRSIASQKALLAMQENLESLQRAEDQMQELQQELEKAQKAQEAGSIEAEKFRAPFPLRSLLKQTYKIESQYYQEKKLNLESKATEVKLRNQKLQKKKTSFLGYYKMAQENSLEEDLNTIVEVKEAITQVTKEIKERNERWRAIEELCGCSLDLSHSPMRV